jgi:hypothetical protein
MIRVLVMIAVAGFLVSVVTLSVAVGIAGPDAIAHGGWSWGPHGWGNRWNFRHRHGDADEGPEASRDMAWTAGQALDFDLPADVRYTQAAGPAKMTISGPKGAVDDVEIENGHIRYAGEHDHDHDAHLSIVITAPSVTHFTMEGSGALTIADYRQDVLNLDMQGDGDITATGEAKSMTVSLSGSGNANLGAVKAAAAKVEIEGSGDATVAPTQSADVTVSGSGDVTLLTRPPVLRSEISGSGELRQKDRDTTPTPPAAPRGAGAKRA